MQKLRILAGLALAGLCTGTAWAGAPVSLDQGMKLLSQPGRWIDTDGALQPDGTYLAKEVQIVATGDTSQTKEAAIYGAVQSLNRAKGTMMVLGYSIAYDKDTTLKDENKRKILSSKIENGMGVKVQGHLQPNGTFMATKIKLQKTKDGNSKPKTKLFGPATVVDARHGLLKVLNTTIKLRDDAQITEQPLSSKAE